jgi:hypothetical protein
MSTIRLPDRGTSPSGKPRPGPDSKETGAALVAKVMQKAEKPQGTSNGKGVKFEVEDTNHAKSSY